MGRTIVDLSLTFGNGVLGVDVEPAFRIASHGFNTTNLSIYSHAATHMDAPKHFIDDGRTIDAVDLEKCVGKALVVDMSHKASDSFITVDDFAPYADRIHAGARILIRTDWDGHAEMDDYRTKFPRISVELAAWLAEKGVWLLGVETPSVASLLEDNRAELSAVHRTLLAAEIIIVESLANLAQLDQDDVYFIALPLKIDGCDGSPTRPIAIIEH